MSLTQETLSDRVASRIRRARPDLAARVDLSTPSGLTAAQREIAAEGGEEGTLAVAVLCRFDLASFAAGVCAFAGRLDPGTAQAWRESFTRTVFLAGNPENLRERFALDHVAADGSAAWSGPGPAGASGGLRRLLKLFDGSGALPAGRTPPVVVPAAAGRPERTGVEHTLHLATREVTVADLLVHLHHLLAEAVLDGIVSPGDRLAVRQAPYLAGVREPFTAVRVAPDRACPDRLRAYAGLTGPG